MTGLADVLDDVIISSEGMRKPARDLLFMLTASSCRHRRTVTPWSATTRPTTSSAQPRPASTARISVRKYHRRMIRSFRVMRYVRSQADYDGLLDYVLNT